MRRTSIDVHETYQCRHIRSGGIRSLLYHGPKRQEGLDEDQFDVVLTTYETLRSDWTAQGPLYARKWARIILDEGKHPI